MPFKKGQSGNPGGRAKGIVSEVKALVGENGEECLKILWKIASGTMTITQHATETGEPYEQEPSFKDRRDAAVELLNRGFGKPRESLELTGKDGGPLETIDLTDEELDARVMELVNASKP